MPVAWAMRNDQSARRPAIVLGGTRNGSNPSQSTPPKPVGRVTTSGATVSRSATMASASGRAPTVITGPAGRHLRRRYVRRLRDAVLPLPLLLQRQRPPRLAERHAVQEPQAPRLLA